MSWVAHLVETKTGRKGAQLQLTADGSWSAPAMGIEEWTATVSKAQLAGIDRDWWAPMRGAVLMSWKGRDGRLKPWLMGPITRPPSEAESTLTLTCKGFGALLQQRLVLAQEYTDMAALAKSRVRREGMSLGTIAQDLVRLATEEKLGGHLPIQYGTARETGAGLNERTYEGHNLANNSLWKRLTELSEVIAGPDIQFRPVFARDDESMLEWVMVHGTAAQPAIEQAWTMDLDTTSSRSPVASINVAHSVDALTNRVYWTGAGEGAGTLIRVAQNDAMLEDGMPLLESVGSTSDSDNPALIAEHAARALAEGARPLQQITVKVDGSDQRCEIGRWRPGDTARVTTGDNLLTVDPGTRPLRIIAAKGSWSSTMVDLEFQEEVQA